MPWTAWAHCTGQICSDACIASPFLERRRHVGSVRARLSHRSEVAPSREDFGQPSSATTPGLRHRPGVSCCRSHPLQPEREWRMRRATAFDIGCWPDCGVASPHDQTRTSATRMHLALDLIFGHDGLKRRLTDGLVDCPSEEFGIPKRVADALRRQGRRRDRGWDNRGVAVGEGKVFSGLLDGNSSPSTRRRGR